MASRKTYIISFVKYNQYMKLLSWCILRMDIKLCKEFKMKISLPFSVSFVGSFKGFKIFHDRVLDNIWTPPEMRLHISLKIITYCVFFHNPFCDDIEMCCRYMHQLCAVNEILILSHMHSWFTLCKHDQMMHTRVLSKIILTVRWSVKNYNKSQFYMGKLKLILIE